MAESYSVEAILSVYDKGFTSGMERAGSLARGLSQQSTATGGGILKMGGAFGLAAAAASKGMQIVSGAMDGAINRFDILNKYPVVMKALGYSAGDVAKSAKLMSNGIDGLPTSLDEITSSAQQLAPLTGSATKAAKSALALNNAFLASGASVADTSRGLQQYTQMLSTGKVDMMSWRTLMETMPIALRKVAKSFGYTGKSAETDLYEALKKGKISVDDLNNAFIKLNKGQGGFADLAKKNSAGIKTSLANLKNSVVKNMGNMLQAINQGFANAGLGSIAGQLNNLKGAINGFFQAITPVVTGVSTAILQVLGGVFRFIQANSNWLAPLAVGVGSFIGTIMGLNKAIGIIKTIKESFSLVNGAIKLAQFAADGFWKLLSVNPFVLAIAGIVAFVGMLTWWITQTESGKNAWKGLVDWFNSGGSTIVGIVGTIIGVIGGLVAIIKIATAVQGIFNAVMAINPFVLVIVAITAVVGALVWFFTQTQLGQQLWQGFVSFLSAAWQGLVGIATTVWTAISTAISVAWTAISTVVMTGVSAVVAFFSGAWNGLVAIVSAVWAGIVAVVSGAISAVMAVINGISAVVGFIGSVMSSIASVFSSGWNRAKSITSQGINAAKNAVTSVAGSMVSAGRNFVMGFVNGISGAIGAAASAAARMAKAALNAAKGALGIHSPSRVMRDEVGFYVGAGLAKGILGNASSVEKASQQLANSALIDPRMYDVNSQFDDLPQIGESAFNANYSGSLQMQGSTLQQENNQLLRQIANKNSAIYLDGETLVGATISETNSQLGNQVNLEGRWG